MDPAPRPLCTAEITYRKGNEFVPLQASAGALIHMGTVKKATRHDTRQSSCPPATFTPLVGITGGSARSQGDPSVGWWAQRGEIGSPDLWPLVG